MEDIKYIIEDFKRKYDILGFPINTYKILTQSMGIIVKPYDFGNDKIDAITFYESKKKKYIVFINKRLCCDRFAKRLNFTLAHELGHIVLGHKKYYFNGCHDIKDPLSINDNIGVSGEYKRHTYEANEFAGELLMPETELRSICGNVNKSDDYMVSKKAMRTRIKILKTREENKGINNITYELPAK